VTPDCTPTLVILPGLDGTGRFASAFAGGDWDGWHVMVLPLPAAGPQDYEALELEMARRLPDGRLVLVGESFSAPLAMRLAALERGRVEALVIAGGFCLAPHVPLLALLPLKPLFLMKPPASLLRRFLLGENAPKETVALLAETIASVPANVLIERIRVVLALEEEQCPSPMGLPVLLLQARHDATVPWEAQSRLERHFPHAQVMWIDAPHLLLEREPDACRDAVKAFLAGL